MVTTHGIALAAAATVAANNEDKVQKVIDAWLSTADMPKGAITHIVAMTAKQALNTTMASLVYPKMQWQGKVDQFANMFSFGTTASLYMNKIADLFRYPNIEGITIFTEKEQQSGTSNISFNPLVVQQDMASTTYVCDNAVPMPREWTLSGYLTAVLPIDHGLVVKPSIMMQRDYLDHCRMSRRPVWYKTFDNRFYRVLISHFDSTWEADKMNALSVNIKLVEYKPLTVNTLRGSIKNANRSLV